jgi:hypothetical protein
MRRCMTTDFDGEALDLKAGMIIGDGDSARL